MSMARQSCIGCMAMILFTMMGALLEDRGLGAEISPAILASFKSGTVTAVYDTSIAINGANYRLKANAEILDHKGAAIGLPNVFVRSEAKFHLDKENEIDMMVVKRPQ